MAAAIPSPCKRCLFICTGATEVQVKPSKEQSPNSRGRVKATATTIPVRCSRFKKEQQRQLQHHKTCTACPALPIGEEFIRDWPKPGWTQPPVPPQQLLGQSQQVLLPRKGFQ